KGLRQVGRGYGGSHHHALVGIAGVVEGTREQVLFVDREGFGDEDYPPAGVEELEIGELDLFHLRSKLGKLFRARIEGREHLGSNVFLRGEEGTRVAEFEASEIPADPAHEIGHREIGAGGVERVVASDDLHGECCILYAPSQGTAVIERIGEWKDAAPR